MARATLTGTGLVRPPSTSTRPLLRTGVKMPGTEMLARTASITSPVVMTTSSPVTMSVATAAKRWASVSMLSASTGARTSSLTRAPSSRPDLGSTMSKNDSVFFQSKAWKVACSSSSLSAAWMAPTRAPMLVPAT